MCLLAQRSSTSAVTGTVGPSLKTPEQEHRYARPKSAKEYEVSMHYTAPDPREFFAVSANKANLLRFLCDEWCENENLKSALGPTHLG